MYLLRLVFLMLTASLLSACNYHSDVTDGDKKVTPEMDQVISNYIVQKYKTAYGETDKQFEVHKIYGTSGSGNTLDVYMWSYYGGFNKSQGTKAQSGHSLPALVRLEKNDGHYEVTKYKEPEDGSLYPSSIKKMFPEKYVKKAADDSGNIGGLEKKMDKKVENWIRKNG
jgi:hypothetical protein